MPKNKKRLMLLIASVLLLIFIVKGNFFSAFVPMTPVNEYYYRLNFPDPIHYPISTVYPARGTYYWETPFEEIKDIYIGTNVSQLSLLLGVDGRWKYDMTFLYNIPGKTLPAIVKFYIKDIDGNWIYLGSINRNTMLETTQGACGKYGKSCGDTWDCNQNLPKKYNIILSGVRPFIQPDGKIYIKIKAEPDGLQKCYGESVYPAIGVCTGAYAENAMCPVQTGMFLDVYIGTIYAFGEKAPVEHACRLDNNEMLITETYVENKFVNINTFRYPVKRFCEGSPIVITDAINNEVWSDYVSVNRLKEGETINIPEKQTWTFFYVTDMSLLPVVCEAGTYDATTGKCVVYPGIVHVCSQGLFDPNIGACVIQPGIEYICPEGYYDTLRNSCVVHPPINYICEEGYYDVNAGKCIVEPDIEYKCTMGIYNFSTGKCEYYPSVGNICIQGVYDEISNLCIVNPEINYVCAEGVYDAWQKKCMVEPSIGYQCTIGTYDSVNKICIVNPDIKKQCIVGTYDETIDKCIVIPEINKQCVYGVYDQRYDKCIINPDQQISCIAGTYNDELKVCVVNPEVVTHVQCPNNTVYEPSLDVCIYNPLINYKCLMGTYDRETGTCLVNPDIQQTQEFEKKGITTNMWIWIGIGVVALIFFLWGGKK